MSSENFIKFSSDGNRLSISGTAYKTVQQVTMKTDEDGRQDNPQLRVSGKESGRVLSRQINFSICVKKLNCEQIFDISNGLIMVRKYIDIRKSLISSACTLRHGQSLYKRAWSRETF